jgi:hypothetical protein
MKKSAIFFVIPATFRNLFILITRGFQNLFCSFVTILAAIYRSDQIRSTSFKLVGFELENVERFR